MGIWIDNMGRFTQKLNEKLMMKKSRPHAELVKWALIKARSVATEAEHLQYDALINDSLIDLDKFLNASIKAEMEDRNEVKTPGLNVENEVRK